MNKTRSNYLMICGNGTSPPGCGGVISVPLVLRVFKDVKNHPHPSPALKKIKRQSTFFCCPLRNLLRVLTLPRRYH